MTPLVDWHATEIESDKKRQLRYSNHSKNLDLIRFFQEVLFFVCTLFVTQAIFQPMRLGVFSADQACRLAKISDTQLRYWFQTRVFRPQTLSGTHGAFRRVYSFRDIVGLRTISILRNTHKVRLDDLREVEHRLKDTPDKNWANVVFYVGEDRRIYFDDPTSKARVAINPLGQVSLFRMRTIIKSVERQLALINRRTKKQIGKIDHSRFILKNAFVLAGTRIPTSSIYDLYQAGFNISRIVSEYPRLTQEDVRSAIQFEQLQVAS